MMPWEARGPWRSGRRGWGEWRKLSLGRRAAGAMKPWGQRAGEQSEWADRVGGVEEAGMHWSPLGPMVEGWGQRAVRGRKRACVGALKTQLRAQGRWGHEAMGPEDHGEQSEWAVRAGWSNLGPMAKGWAMGQGGRALGRWGHEAMGPEGHGGEVEQVGMHGPKTQLDVGVGPGPLGP